MIKALNKDKSQQWGSDDIVYAKLIDLQTWPWNFLGADVWKMSIVLLEFGSVDDYPFFWVVSLQKKQERTAIV